MFFINFLLFDIFLFLSKSCAHTTKNIVLSTLKPILLSFTILLKFWNGKQWTSGTRALPQIFNFWSLHYKWINFPFFINRIFGYRSFCCGFSIHRSFNSSPFHHSSFDYHFFNNCSMYYILPTRLFNSNNVFIKNMSRGLHCYIIVLLKIVTNDKSYDEVNASQAFLPKVRLNKILASSVLNLPLFNFAFYADFNCC